ncbi:hypothetical protein CSV69_14545 [Sporosarcina sp. P26b]|uniref:TRAP transporter small permease n=1 Tax=Sporosarcina sp. P26b TaxID=2048253 RepID=UPI000C163965|nr:TRAP transporter small permease [Sporosarcina sp. P26b]PIC94850.1 hypothetical protein CSV69_14545 [Sporosarcina sp. P26b]
MLLKRIDLLIEKFLEFIITFCLSITVSLTLVQVFFRFVLKQPLSWSQEVVMISFVYSVLFGAALAFKDSEHLTVDIFESAKEKVQKFLNVFSYIVVLIMIIVFIYFGLTLVLDNLKSGQIIGFLPIKKGYVYMALPISSLFMLYYHVKRVFKWLG